MSKFDPKWTGDLLKGKRRRSCSDDTFLKNNGNGWKLFSLLLDLLHGKYGK